MTHLGRRRGSTAATYLSHAKRRSNLRVETNAVATQIIVFKAKPVSGSAFSRAIRARSLACGGGKFCSVRARSTHRSFCRSPGSAGAGIFNRFGVPIIEDLPGVGQNLSDHYITRLQYRLSHGDSLNRLSRFPHYLHISCDGSQKADGAFDLQRDSPPWFSRAVEPDSRRRICSSCSRPEAIRRPAAFSRDEPGVSVNVCPARPGQPRAASWPQVQTPSNDPSFGPTICLPKPICR